VQALFRVVAAGLAGLCLAAPAMAKDLGDILVEKGLITAEELQSAREEEKQKAAAEESRRDAIAAKLPAWLSMFTPFGDVRLRTEGFYAQDLNARTRERLRARLGFTVAPVHEVSATIRIATGNPDDPISTNQSFERTFTRKSINLDQAFVTIKPGQTFGLAPGWGSLRAGKMPVTAYQTSEMVFDDDLSPEGAQEQLVLVEHREGPLRSVKVNGFQWVVDETSSGGEPWMGGGQIVTDLAVGNVATMTFAFADYSWQDMDKVAKKFLERSSSSFNGQLAVSNAVDRDPDGKITGFDSNFNVVNLGGEVNFPNVWKTYSTGLFSELAWNSSAHNNRDLGFTIGAGFGSSGRDWYHNNLKTPGQWAVSYAFQRVEQDAVPAMFAYSDTEYVTSAGSIRGSTNAQASIVRLDYVLFPNFQITAKGHFINCLDTGNSTAAVNGNATLFRGQLDAVLRF
jgi:hypothetical protein